MFHAATHNLHYSSIFAAAFLKWELLEKVLNSICHFNWPPFAAECKSCNENAQKVGE